jgi:alkyl sulfatase BDS1-like metallo-beta-lactamase superfamily hydrolase
VTADAGNTAARELLARAYERQAAGVESAIWRNMYLSGAQELRDGVRASPAQGASLDFVRNTPTPMLLDLMAVRVDPEKAKDGDVSVDLIFPDRKERFRVRIRRAVLTYEANPPAGKVDAVLTMPRAQFLSGALAGADLSGTTTSGDRTALGRLLSWLTPPKPGFPIVTR